MDPSKNDNHVQYNHGQYNSVQPESTDSLPSSQSFQNVNPGPPSVKPVLNYSIRTGEEFALEFMRDRVNTRMPYVQYPAGDPSRASGYMELKGILGISHTGSESGSDISMVNIVERGPSGLENHNSSLYETTSNSSRVLEYASSGASDSASKIKILCSFGGKILPRPSDGKLRYVGGNTRIIRIRRDIFWQELRQKMLEIYIETYAVKYQLPGEDLDALVSVSSDEDLQNMMEECNVLGIGEGSQKLRLFLFSLSDLEDTNLTHANSGGDNEFQFVVAVNGMDMGSRRESSMHGLMRSSGNNLSELDGQNIPISRAATEFVGSNTSPLNLSDLNSSISMPELSNAYENPNQMHHIEPSYNIQQHLAPETSVPLNPNGFVDRQGEFTEGHPYRAPVMQNRHLQNPNGLVDRQGDFTEGHPSRAPVMQNRQPQNPNGLVDRQGEFTEVHPSRAPVMQNRQPQNPNGLVDRQGEFTEGQPSRAPVMQNRQPQNPNGLVDRQGDFTEGHPSRAPVMQNRQPQKEEKPKGDNSAQQEVKQTNIRSPRDDVASSTLPSEGKLPPKPKMNEERHQEHIQSKVVASNDNDSVTSSSAAAPDNSGSDLIDLSYLEPPPRVYHSEIIPRGQVEKNRLTKSDDSLGSQLLASHLQSDVEPHDYFSESVGNLHNENLPAEDRTAVKNDQVPEAANTSDVKMKNDKKVKFDKSAETGSQKMHHPYPAPNSQAATGVTGGGVKVQEEILIDINDRFPSNFLSDVFTRAMAEDGPGMGVLPQDGVGMSMNIANHEPKHWSFFQKLAGDEFRQKDVSLIDQDHLAYLSRLQNVQEEVSVGYNASQFPDDVDSRNTYVEDEGKEIPGSESTSMQPHYNPSHKSIEGMQFDDPSENTRMPDSEYEVSARNDGLPSVDSSLGDLDISSLQIIRNEDLEELRELGSGTFGTVYHGKWRGTDVAIKRIKKSCFAGRSSEQERLTIEFWREADILSKLHHPNVMAFYGVVQDGPDGTLATVTEFMVDGSLRHVLLRKDRHLDHRKRLIIAMDAAFGMEYLHSKNIVHFDLKCDNLLVNMKDSSRPICKVGDFGLSKIKRNTLVSGGVRGTLPWMAPELLNGGSNKVSEKVDVFSFGIVLWEILTREEPYANMHYGAIIGGIVNNTLRPTIPSDCDPEWRRLMELCWSPDPAVRPSFTEITNQLRVMSAACQSKGHAHKAT
ncbi:hypothetical protein CTI12_AA410620 [Artemisia annua]|uniref:Protein kinase domain-containing protein n=1 Tax=Artemisia annua TaxID=35608 RepID=A0A2U1M8J3_ARTAN|nr:hypothetical protein CTI12_AA410620 [Artemisia annua]